MAVRTACPHCSKKFTAPDDYLGRRVECPRCGRRSVLRSLADLDREAEAAAEEERQREAAREKIAFIEGVQARATKKPGRPYYEEYQTGRQAVRHFDPRAPSRFARIRTLSDLLIVGAYVELMLVAFAIVVTLYLWMRGILSSGSILVMCIIGWMLAGVALYLIFKCLGELVSLFADLADQQADTVRLLLDIRENTDPTDET
jgi:hypothetical protein